LLQQASLKTIALNTRSQLLIDKLVFRPLGWLLNVAVRIAGKILFINHDLNRAFTTIAVCKFKGMGSIVQSTPMLAALRERYPKATIIYVSSIQNRDLLKHITVIDKSILLNDQQGVFKLVTSVVSALIALVRVRPQVYIDLEIYSNFSTVFTALTLSRNRFGYYLRSSGFRMGIYTHMMFFNPKVPIWEVYLQMARLLGYSGDSPPLLYLGSGGQGNPGLAGPYIVVNPNASDLRIERRWPTQSFVASVRKLAALYPEMLIYLIGSPSEQAYTQTIKDAVGDLPQVVNLAGKTSFAQLLAVIENARVVITNDTGPMHLSFACRVPVVCLFGPCSPDQYGSTHNSISLYKPVYCSPCVHDFEIPPCAGNNVCMQGIGVDEVVEAAVSLMEGNGAVMPQKKQPVYVNNKAVIGLVKRP
jgi:ADP-heptose:LPS heptosyltransferase